MSRLCSITKNRCASVNQLAKCGEQFLNVVEMQSGCRLVENIQHAFVRLRGEMRGKL